MSKYNFEGAKISAKNLHIGDVYNYSSSQDFIRKHKDLKLSDTEIELVEIIFTNTSSEQERQSIIESLKSIKSGKGTDEEKQKSILSFKPLINFLKDSGKKIAVNLITKILTNYATDNNLSTILTELFK